MPETKTRYRVTVTTDARDCDGNHHNSHDSEREYHELAELLGWEVLGGGPDMAVTMSEGGSSVLISYGTEEGYRMTEIEWEEIA